MAKKKSKKVKITPKQDTTELRGVLILLLSFAFFLSLLSFSIYGTSIHNWLGIVGYSIGWSLTALFGLSSYLISFFVGWIGWQMALRKQGDDFVLKTLSVLLGVVSVCFLLTVLEDHQHTGSNWIGSVFYPVASARKIHYHLGGAPFYYLYRDLPSLNLFTVLNVPGVALFFFGTLTSSVLLLAKISPIEIFSRIFSFFQQLKRNKSSDIVEEPEIEIVKKEVIKVTPQADSDFMRYVKLRIPGNIFSTSSSNTDSGTQPQGEMLVIKPEFNLKSRPSLSRKEQADPTVIEKVKTTPIKVPTPSIAPTVQAATPSNPTNQKRETAIAAQKVYNGDFSGYKLPSINLLTNAKKADHSSLKKDLRHKAEVLEETLSSFGIEAKVGQINCGPTITSFEVHPAIGVKVQKIKTLENDIALNMEAKSIRIIAPIPGKAAVGIEVPNAQPEEVGFKEMLANYQQAAAKFRIPILLGKAVNGEYVMSDLTKMPHCIIAGATGSGKSVCINTIVMSILLNARPDEIKLVMVDPKKVELTPYTRLPHMLAPVITEPQGACAALNWLVKEMEKRYELLKQTGVRNIDAFNNRIIDKALEETLRIEIPAKLPYIVGIIDELADLMMVASSDIETPIARIAQMARAVGIHLILATQRPSREVITGLIKANFPTRISFKVSSRVNSMIVLDDTGAEALLGNGDMLFLPPGTSHLVRAQGAFIRDEDINAVVKCICDQAPPRYLIESFDRMGSSDSSGEANDDDSGDALYAQAKDVILGTGNASTTFLQRKLKIGYARAASLMDVLEKKGIVGPAEGSKPRKVLAALPNKIIDEEEDLLLQNDV